MTTKLRGFEITTTVKLVTETCCNCGVVFAMAEEFKQECLRETDGKSFYCPAGHAQHYVGKSDAQKLREAEERLASEKAWSQRITNDLNAERKSHASTKGQLTRNRNRANAGVCLDCHRTFVDVQKHRRDKHGASDAATGKRA
jgi:hypothetical protein